MPRRSTNLEKITDTGAGRRLMLLTPIDGGSLGYAGPCSHPHKPRSHAPFAGFAAACGKCGVLYTVRGCGDTIGRTRTLPPDPKTNGAFGLVSVKCPCGNIADVGVPAEAIPETLIASGVKSSAPRTAPGR
jgi:hypothetical protein